MISTSSLHEVCGELFAEYALAVSAVNASGAMHSMVLMLPEGDDAQFFVLLRVRRDGGPFYSLYPWHAGEVVDIEFDSSASVPDVIVNALTHGVPIPRHGSLLGWGTRGPVIALIAVYAEHTSAHLEPCWTVMPLTSIPEGQWPPFTKERLLGNWFWEHYRAKKIVSLANLISRTQHAVFWVNTSKILGSDCCAVAHDIISPEGHILQRGSYAYYKALRADIPIPPLKELLADPAKVDLAGRFRCSAHSDG